MLAIEELVALPNGRLDAVALEVKLVVLTGAEVVVIDAIVALDGEDVDEDSCASKKELAEYGENVAKDSTARALVAETVPEHLPNCGWHPGPMCSGVFPQ